MKALTPAQTEALCLILDTFAEQYPPKYRHGAEEHGGCLADMTPLDLAYNLLGEGMDSVAYAIILIKQLEAK